ncbi:hypothetical protein [Viridibacterium curvum]|uniref:Uncharacterized protein n=1 Tax=Viridibacterium curvum TaxID=1101404 RepID=A0ABP9QPW1_9RHOO
MSQDLSLYLPKDRLPSTRTWNRLLREAGFKLKLPADLEPGEDQGWVPCNDDIGFDFSSGPLDEVITDGPNGTPVDWSITLGCQSDAALAAAYAALACLAGHAGGYVLDTYTGESLTSDQALARAITLQQALTPKTRKVNPFSNALRTILKPELEKQGFKKLSATCYYRIRHLTCQYLNFEKYRHDPAHYRASCFIVQLAPKKTSTPAWKLFPLGSEFMAYGTPAEVTASMQRVLGDFKHVALPGFAQFDTLEKLVAQFDSLYADAEYSSQWAHDYADFACILAYAGRLNASRRFAEFAKRGYQEWAEEIRTLKPSAVWPDASVALMNELLTALDEGRHMTLVTEWRRESLKAAKVPYEEV